MSAVDTENKEISLKELKQEYTNEFIVLGLFYFAQKYGFELGRMKTVKLLWKFKDLVQKNLGLQTYYTEAYKDKHGRFSKDIYAQLNDLKVADFITTSGTQPFEKFIISPKGEKVFDTFEINDEKTKYALGLAKSQLDYIVKENGEKSAMALREEDHKDIVGIDKLPEKDEDIVLSPNLKPEETKYQFLFDEQEALDWSVAIGVGKRKKTEEIIPEDLLPKSQEQAYKILGL